ncbi:MAG: CPXCG motif-containing cysteine-rich protein [Anaeromyxobacteraceae bacterium]
MDQEVECPACGVVFVVFVDPRGGEEQLITAECPECRRPLTLLAREEEPGGFAVAFEQHED